jgi:hypothetical protein
MKTTMLMLERGQRNFILRFKRGLYVLLSLFLSKIANWAISEDYMAVIV